MVKQLFQGMYGTEFRHNGGPFGLTCGQSRQTGCHNAGWYNAAGEKIGWGGLDHADMARIAKEINADELFVVLGEYESHWVTDNIVLTPSDKDKPGPQYVGLKCSYIIEKGQCFMVYPGRDFPTSMLSQVEGVHFDYMHRRDAYNKVLIATNLPSMSK